MRKVVVIIQARMGSTRLPGKALLPVEERPVLEWVIKRVHKAKLIDQVMVATTIRSIDKPIAELCRRAGIVCFRGSEQNVLQRFYLAAKQQRADIVVRITADCPLIDPTVIDLVIGRHFENGNDYTASNVGKTFPRGMDIEVVNFSSLATAYKLATAFHHQEHVTSFIYHNPKLFKIENVNASKKDSSPYLRLCVDEPADLELVRRICAYFRPRTDFSLSEIISLIKHHPAIARINRRIKQKTMARRFVFRVDGNSRLGLGHISRSISLANELAKQGDILFVYRNDPIVGRMLKANHFKAHSLKKSRAWEFSIYSGDDVLITDSPLIDSGYLKQAKERVGLLVSIYYGGKKVFYPSDIVINPNLSQPKISISKQTKYYSGGKYAIIGGNYRRIARKIKREIKNILICFGGSDPSDITLRMVKILKSPEFGKFKKILVAGPGYKNYSHLAKATHALQNSVLKSAVPDMSGLLKDADLAVLSGGVLMHEAAASGVPAIIISHNAEQNLEAKAFNKYGIACNLGVHNNVFDRQITKALDNLIFDAQIRRRMAANARRIDTNGAKRIASIIEQGAAVR